MRTGHIPRRIFHSLKAKLILIFLLLMIPMNALLSTYNSYSQSVVFNQAAKANNNMLTLYIREIDETFKDVDSFLISTLAANPYIPTLGVAGSAEDVRYTFAKVQIGNSFQNQLLYFGGIYALFAYPVAFDDIIFQTYNSNANGMDASDLKAYLDTNPSEWLGRLWTPCQIGGEYYLLHVYQMLGVRVGACVRVSDLIVPLDLVNLGKDGFAFLVSKDYTAITDAERVRRLGLALGEPTDDYSITNGSIRFLLSGVKFASGDFYLFTAIPESTLLESLPMLRRMSLIGVGLSVLVLVLALLLIRRLIFVPLRRINAVMREFVGDNPSVRMTPETGSTELEIISSTFNDMLSQIQTLKMRMYEDELERQRAELKHLQLQVNPHFFLNSLNIIFQLAQAKRYDLIQKMAHCLVDYFRYMFRSNSDYVSLGDELNHTENYLRIQQMRFPGRLEYCFRCDEGLSVARVPPLIIQTFVENSVKYAMHLDHVTRIAVTIGRAVQPNGSRIRICIEDNGGGFPEEILRVMRSPQAETPAEDWQIGLRNARKRLLLLYEGQATLQISNPEEGGALVEMTLPTADPSETPERRHNDV